MPITLPTTAFDPTKTIIPKKTYVVLTPTVAGVAGTPVTIPGKVANFKEAIESLTRDVPDAEGYLVPDREVPKTRKQSVEYEVEDVKLLTGVFGGTAINGSLMKGTCELFILDPDDATGKVAVHANAFKATWKLADGINFGHGNVTKTNLTITALEKVLLLPDVATT